jgi:hypothetical protein
LAAAKKVWRPGMLREHAPLIGLAVVTALLFYLVFRDLRGLHEAVSARSAVTFNTAAAKGALPSATPAAKPAAADPGRADRAEQADEAEEYSE